MYNKILLPIDFDDLEMGGRLVAVAKEFAHQRQKVKSRLINVQPIMPASVIAYLPPNFDEEHQKDCERRLLEISTGAAFPPETLSNVVRYGSIYQEVVAEAEDWRADLIIVGSHKPGIWSYLLGSSAEAIVRHAKCSVLVVRR